MFRPRSEIDPRARAQNHDIARRREFLTFNEPTRNATIVLLQKMSQIDPETALNLFYSQTKSMERDVQGIDWMRIHFYIWGACINDGGEWSPVQVVPKRLEQEIVVLEGLLEIK